MDLKRCTCDENAGCTNKCDRGMNNYEKAIYEARSIPPSSREQTLDWILKRVKELNLELIYK